MTSETHMPISWKINLVDGVTMWCIVLWWMMVICILTSMMVSSRRGATRLGEETLSTRLWKIGWCVNFMWLGGGFNSNIKMHVLISEQIEKEQKKELSPLNCSCLSGNVIHGPNVFVFSQLFRYCPRNLMNSFTVDGHTQIISQFII
jgi:hypothetical protein